MKHKKGKANKIQSCPAAPSCVPSGHRGTAAVMMQLSADPEGQSCPAACKGRALLPPIPV